MPLEVYKQRQENSHNLFRRFSRRIRYSRILREARRRQFKLRNKSEQLKKRSALRKVARKKEYEILKKLGLKR